MRGSVVAVMLGATICKAMAALLRWLRVALFWPSWEAAATTASQLLWLRLLRRASPGDTAPWSELPPELLGLVLSRLPSQADRVRLRAVCRTWRSAPRPSPPPFPWIVLRDDTFLILPNGAPHRLPRHLCCDEIKFRVSAGSVLFLRHYNGGCCLVNPCSGETTPLKISLTGYNRTLKVVLSDHYFAFLIKGDSESITIIPREPRPGARHMTWEPSVNICDCIIDIALFRGKLYVLAQKSNGGAGPQQQLELHLLDINHEQNRVWSVRCISATPINFVPPCSSNITITTQFYFYLVASGDRLLMVERQIDIDAAYVPLALRPIHSWIKVSEAVDLIGGHGRWSEVDRLMGRALFVGRECSDSLPAQCGAREDCIYFMTERSLFDKSLWRDVEDDLLGCVVYNVRNRIMEPLTWEKGETRNGRWHPTWLFPADV